MGVSQFGHTATRADRVQARPQKIANARQRLSGRWAVVGRQTTHMPTRVLRGSAAPVFHSKAPAPFLRLHPTIQGGRRLSIRMTSVTDGTMGDSFTAGIESPVPQFSCGAWDTSNPIIPCCWSGVGSSSPATTSPFHQHPDGASQIMRVPSFFPLLGPILPWSWGSVLWGLRINQRLPVLSNQRPLVDRHSNQAAAHWPTSAYNPTYTGILEADGAHHLI